MSQILETIIEFITSEKVAYVISLIGALYIPVQGIVSKITNKKLNKKELVDQVEQFKKMGIYYLQVKSLNSNSFVCFQTSCCFIKFDFFSDDF